MQLITGSHGVERCINMAVTLREIIKQVQHLEMKLVAGETGLDHEVSWTHMVDSDTISAFLQGQELTFTTGLGLNENLTLLRLVKEVWRNKASGIVINTGLISVRSDRMLLILQMKRDSRYLKYRGGFEWLKSCGSYVLQ